ncbi:MAG: hypothetical protein WAS21_00220 [Geminicoccaceae bacterium]
MAQIARTEADKTTNTAKAASDNVAELGKQTTVKTAEVMRRATGQAENTMRENLQAVRQTVDVAAEAERKTVRHVGAGLSEINQALMETFTAQARDNAELLQALTKPANWGQTAKLQSEFLQASLMRTVQLTRRYVEVSQAVMTSALAIGRDQAKKAA